ncbi:hypothetical protein [Streptomyces sp. W4I9-2]|uniref:hypothetical protein n=1 Tax=Streptomyces sp. W4I9-2 TaxID=3042297 RepID=UPI002781A586|nr:hypothetical protein [Streptomyces sp. W4I9-2]MDQ0696559.1 hypothetical protein [Streptomyces sp. W4I9-2]
MPNTVTETPPGGETFPRAAVDRHRRWWSGWLDWSVYLAVAWSALYAAAALYWALGGDGYPFERVDEDRSSGSILEPSRAEAVAPVLALFCALGVVAGLLMLKNLGTGRVRKVLLAYGWVAGVALTLLIPDYSLLGLLAFSPALLVSSSPECRGRRTWATSCTGTAGT